jgi:predicted ATPase
MNHDNCLDHGYRRWIAIDPLGRRILESLLRTPNQEKDHLIARLVREGADYGEVMSVVGRLNSDRLTKDLSGQLGLTLEGLLHLDDLPEAGRTLKQLAKVITTLHRIFDPGQRRVSPDQIAEDSGIPRDQLGPLLELVQVPEKSGALTLGMDALGWKSFDAFLDARVGKKSPPRVHDDRPPLSIAVEGEAVEWSHVGVFKHAKLDLGRITVLIGGNGTGKTTALRVLDLCSKIAREGLVAAGRAGDLLTDGEREMVLGVIAACRRPPPSTTTTGINWSINAQIHPQLLVNSELARSWLPDQRPPIATFTRGTGQWRGPGGQPIDHVMTPSDLALIKASDVAAHGDLIALAQWMARWRILVPALPAPEWAGVDPVQRQASEIPHEAMEAFREAVVRVTQVRNIARRGRSTWLVDDGDGTYRPLEMCAAGVQRAFEILEAALLPEPPPLLAIDEIELHLHPDLAGRLMEALRACSKRTQLVLTTHSPVILRTIGNCKVQWLERKGRYTEIIDASNDAFLAELIATGDLSDAAYTGYLARRP